MGLILGLQSGGEEEEKGRAHPGVVPSWLAPNSLPPSPTHTPWGPGYHTRTSELRAWLLRAAQACLWSTVEGSLEEGLPAWLKVPPGSSDEGSLPPSPLTPFQVLLRGHLLGPPGGTKQQFHIPVP